jgi:hypothetical protein
MKYIVHLREKRTGQLVVEAETSPDAVNKVKRMIHTKSLPAGAIDRESGIIVTFTEDV